MDHLDLHLDQLFRPLHFEARRKFERGQDDFFKFPETVGWTEKTGNFSDPSHTNLNGFFQQWLFFGLLYTVLEGIDIREDEFVEDGNRIHTRGLKDLLATWEEDVQADDKGMTMRMIRAQLCLDRAREVVSKFCSFRWEEWEEQVEPTKLSNQVDKSLALSLLVIGETLTNAKSRIVERVGFTIRGWHGDANEGWGTPAVVVYAMLKTGWCRRTIYVLSCQLQSHATALLASYKAYEGIGPENGEFHILQGHDDCNKDRCAFKSTEEDGKTYKPRHRPSCTASSGCKMLGPKVKEVVDAINKGQTPLLEYDRSKSEVNVKPHEAFVSYATISHVWSDGRGNRETSELAECQLQHISDLILRSRWHDKSQRYPLFWIDTLAIPRHGQYDDERKIAVSRIDEVYRNAKFTIVLDLGLEHVIPGTQYHEIAIRVLASGWMRRLWTLQEAYLSRRIIFAFRDNQLLEVDEIEDKFLDAKHTLTSNLATSARTYFRHIMGPERRSRIFNVAPENKYDVISSVWRSAQWRTIQRRTDEPVVLRALFELNRKRASSLRDVPDTRRGPTASRANPQNPHSPTEEDMYETAKMMAELWTSLDEQSPGCIPPGIIFLPGDRLPIPGFGWAPSSWMSGREIEHPDPLSLPQSRATLVHGKGLSVKYPGFLLHCQDPGTVVWPNSTPVQFPCDSTLLEWYEMERADLKEETPPGIKLEKMRFAILLCRPKPRERKEIALLVDIVDKIHQGLHGSNAISIVYKAQIVCRVYIQRVIAIDRSSAWRDFQRRTGEGGKDFICGEELSSDQEWLVDRYTDELPTSAVRPGNQLTPALSQAQTPNQTPSLPQNRPRIYRGGNRTGGRPTARNGTGQSNAASTGISRTGATGAIGGPPRRSQTSNGNMASASNGQPDNLNGPLPRRTTDLGGGRGRGTNLRRERRS